jgi:hypothetical protein
MLRYGSCAMTKTKHRHLAGSIHQCKRAQHIAILQLLVVTTSGH